MENYSFQNDVTVKRILSTKKDAQCDSCELGYIWGKMRTAVQEASQIV